MLFSGQQERTAVPEWQQGSEQATQPPAGARLRDATRTGGSEQATKGWLGHGVLGEKAEIRTSPAPARTNIQSVNVPLLKMPAGSKGLMKILSVKVLVRRKRPKRTRSLRGVCCKPTTSYTLDGESSNALEFVTVYIACIENRFSPRDACMTVYRS